MSRRIVGPPLVVFFVLASIVLGSVSIAEAYHHRGFIEPVSEGGGHFMYFTGSPRFKNYDCTMCHVGSEGRIGVDLSSQPAELIAQGVYQPSTLYSITLRMTDEHKGDTKNPNGYDMNGFVAEFVDDAGAPQGSYDTLPPDAEERLAVYTMAELDAAGDPGVVGAYGGRGQTEWTITWSSPAASKGRLSLHLGAVDGNAANGGPDAKVDPFGDDVFVGRWRFCEGSAGCDQGFAEVDVDAAFQSPSAHGCQLSWGPGPVPWLWALLLAGVAVCWRRRRRRGALIAIGMAGGALLVASCHEVAQPAICETMNCEHDTSEDPTGTAPSLDADVFRCQVEPVLAARCAFYPCHGDENRPLTVYALNRLRDHESAKAAHYARKPTCETDPPKNCVQGKASGEFPSCCALPATPGDYEGPIECKQTKHLYCWIVDPLTEEERQANQDDASAFANADDPGRSLLLLKPLDTRGGGYIHDGASIYGEGDVFASTDDPGYKILEAWIDGAATAKPNCEPITGVGP